MPSASVIEYIRRVAGPAGAARTCTGKAERKGYAADAVRLLQEAGLADAAAQLALDLAEPVTPPEPVVERLDEPDIVPASSPWPARGSWRSPFPTTSRRCG